MKMWPCSATDMGMLRDLILQLHNFQVLNGDLTLILLFQIVSRHPGKIKQNHS